MAEEKKETEKETPKEKEDLVPKSELEELRKELEGYKEEAESKIESLQDSLDSALEDIALRGRTPEAEPEGEAPEGPEPSENPEGEGEPEEGSEEVNVEGEIEKAIKEDESFREEILLKEETRDLKEELAEALRRFPEADEEEILLDIEDGIEEDNPNQVLTLAEASHNRRVSEAEHMKRTLEEDLKAKLGKESEGEISVPQSGGSPTSSETPKAPPEKEKGSTSPLEEEEEWFDALRKAKADREEE